MILIWLSSWGRLSMVTGEKSPNGMWNAGGLDYGRSFRETFFSKEGIVFDPNTGKLNTAAPTKALLGLRGIL